MSVVAITYNHEAFIRDALDGFVAQQTDFSVEIIVADDASTDATPEIIQEYVSRYPHLFRPILRSENIGPNANATDALSAARGEYLALCEGDDYWTDSMKLSKQVAFLDRHPETAVCFHPVRLIWIGGGAGNSTFAQLIFLKFAKIFLRNFPPIYWGGDLSIESLISRNFIQTNSVVYRRLACYDDIPADVIPMDWYLHVRHAVHGDIAMLAETMAVYRRHPQGIWYGAIVDPAKFWRTYGPGHVAMFEAMLDLFPDDPVREEIVVRNANWILNIIARRVPGPEGRALVLDIIEQHPRIARLVLHHRAAQTWFKGLWGKLAAFRRSWRGLVDASSYRFKRLTRRDERRIQPRHAD